tara:strand:+ start:135 stop:272 length:138 start_codon:yes stop_codon:yes gene_type:complete
MVVTVDVIIFRYSYSFYCAGPPCRVILGGHRSFVAGAPLGTHPSW